MWAAIAKAEPVKPAPKQEDADSKPRVAVVDANAIISKEGLLQLMRFNDRVVTIPEVLREVRDKQSRQALQSLPFSIQTQEPSEDSVKAVMRFARATGDAHALSSVDVRLLALAHTLEVSYYGSSHLRSTPAPARVAKKKARDNKHLPGWGAEGGDWAELDRLNEEELAAAEAALMAGSTSRIATGIQELTLGSDSGSLQISLRQPKQQQQQQQPTTSQAPLANGSAQAAEAAVPADGNGEGSAAEQGQQGAGSAAGGSEAADSGSHSESEGEEGEDEWETAARTKNKQRRQRRRAIRRVQREAEEQAAAAAAAATEAEESDSDDYTTASDSDEEESEEEGAGCCGGSEAASDQPAAPASAVCSVTADFAMQNVLLQMGLRLVAPDGRRISTLSRWVLRCTACFAVTKEMGRLFCPRCGNAALDKVRVVVGPDGTEQYGVRKKHILRGTKFSLPKPKGGRANDVILREDQLLAKAHRLRKKKSEKEELDPFAPEYTDETWHTFQAAAVKGGDKGAAALLAGWKHNPNERRHIATNRRRK